MLRGRVFLAFSILPVMILCHGIACWFGLKGIPASLVTGWMAGSIYGVGFWWANR
jgi:hypothetical protein